MEHCFSGATLSLAIILSYPTVEYMFFNAYLLHLFLDIVKK